jgi:transposase-like protein
MVRKLRAELGTSQGTVKRVARQLGYGVESVRSWVKQAEIDRGETPGVTTSEAARIKQLDLTGASTPCGPRRPSWTGCSPSTVPSH